ncbi:sterol desaturase family protein [Rubrivirga marina]|nr:sterol desaturase family protein [Rubrivirga marina]
MLRFALLTFAAFAAMEVLSYVLHRWLLHGPLWKMHRTHHDPAHGHGDGLEWNDLFAVAWGALSVGLIWAGRADPLASTAFPLGVGIAVYGVLYFVLHDLYAHGRLGPRKTGVPAAQAIKRAHGRHHQSLSKDGQEPYGLFLFPPSMGRRFERKRDRPPR